MRNNKRKKKGCLCGNDQTCCAGATGGKASKGCAGASGHVKDKVTVKRLNKSTRRTVSNTCFIQRMPNSGIYIACLQLAGTVCYSVWHSMGEAKHWADRYGFRLIGL